MTPDSQRSHNLLMLGIMLFSILTPLLGAVPSAEASFEGNSCDAGDSYDVDCTNPQPDCDVFTEDCFQASQQGCEGNPASCEEESVNPPCPTGSSKSGESCIPDPVCSEKVKSPGNACQTHVCPPSITNAYCNPHTPAKQETCNGLEYRRYDDTYGCSAYAPTAPRSGDDACEAAGGTWYRYEEWENDEGDTYTREREPDNDPAPSDPEGEDTNWRRVDSYSFCSGAHGANMRQPEIQVNIQDYCKPSDRVITIWVDSYLFYDNENAGEIYIVRNNDGRVIDDRNGRDQNRWEVKDKDIGTSNSYSYTVSVVYDGRIVSRSASIENLNCTTTVLNSVQSPADACPSRVRLEAQFIDDPRSTRLWESLQVTRLRNGNAEETYNIGWNYPTSSDRSTVSITKSNGWNYVRWYDYDVDEGSTYSFHTQLVYDERGVDQIPFTASPSVTTSRCSEPKITSLTSQDAVAGDNEFEPNQQEAAITITWEYPAWNYGMDYTFKSMSLYRWAVPLDASGGPASRVYAPNESPGTAALSDGSILVNILPIGSPCLPSEGTTCGETFDGRSNYDVLGHDDPVQIVQMSFTDYAVHSGIQYEYAILVKTNQGPDSPSNDAEGHVARGVPRPVPWVNVETTPYYHDGNFRGMLPGGAETALLDKPQADPATVGTRVNCEPSDIDNVQVFRQKPDKCHVAYPVSLETQTEFYGTGLIRFDYSEYAGQTYAPTESPTNSKSIAEPERIILEWRWRGSTDDSNVYECSYPFNAFDWQNTGAEGKVRFPVQFPRDMRNSAYFDEGINVECTHGYTELPGALFEDTDNHDLLVYAWTSTEGRSSPTIIKDISSWLLPNPEGTHQYGIEEEVKEKRSWRNWFGWKIQDREGQVINPTRTDTIYQFDYEVTNHVTAPSGFVNTKRTVYDDAPFDVEPRQAFPIDGASCLTPMKWQFFMNRQHDERSIGINSPIDFELQSLANIQVRLLANDYSVNTFQYPNETAAGTHDFLPTEVRLYDYIVQNEYDPGDPGYHDTGHPYGFDAFERKVNATILTYPNYNEYDQRFVMSNGDIVEWENFNELFHFYPEAIRSNPSDPEMTYDGRRWEDLTPKLPFNAVGEYCWVDGMLVIADAFDEELPANRLATKVDLGQTDFRFSHISYDEVTETNTRYNIGPLDGSHCKCLYQTEKITESRHEIKQELFQDYEWFVDLLSVGFDTPLSGARALYWTDVEKQVCQSPDSAEFQELTVRERRECQQDLPQQFLGELGLYNVLLDDYYDNNLLSDIKADNVLQVHEYRWDRQDTPPPQDVRYDNSGSSSTVKFGWAEIRPDLGFKVDQLQKDEEVYGPMLPSNEPYDQCAEDFIGPVLPDACHVVEENMWVVSGDSRPLAFVGGVHEPFRAAAEVRGMEWRFTYDWTYSLNGGSTWQDATVASRTNPQPKLLEYTNALYDEARGTIEWRVVVNATLYDAKEYPNPGIDPIPDQYVFDNLVLTDNVVFNLDKWSLTDTNPTEIGYVVLKDDRSPLLDEMVRGYYYVDPKEAAPWEHTMTEAEQRNSPMSSIYSQDFSSTLLPYYPAYSAEETETKISYITLDPHYNVGGRDYTIRTAEEPRNDLDLTPQEYEGLRQLIADVDLFAQYTWSSKEPLKGTEEATWLFGYASDFDASFGSGPSSIDYVDPPQREDYTSNPPDPQKDQARYEAAVRAYEYEKELRDAGEQEVFVDGQYVIEDGDYLTYKLRISPLIKPGEVHTYDPEVSKATYWSSGASMWVQYGDDDYEYDGVGQYEPHKDAINQWTNYTIDLEGGKTLDAIYVGQRVCAKASSPEWSKGICDDNLAGAFYIDEVRLHSAARDRTYHIYDFQASGQMRGAFTGELDQWKFIQNREIQSTREYGNGPGQTTPSPDYPYSIIDEIIIEGERGLYGGMNMPLMTNGLIIGKPWNPDADARLQQLYPVQGLGENGVDNVYIRGFENVLGSATGFGAVNEYEFDKSPVNSIEGPFFPGEAFYQARFKSDPWLSFDDPESDVSVPYVGHQDSYPSLDASKIGHTFNARGLSDPTSYWYWEVVDQAIEKEWPYTGTPPNYLAYRAQDDERVMQTLENQKAYPTNAVIDLDVEPWVAAPDVPFYHVPAIGLEKEDALIIDLNKRSYWNMQDIRDEIDVQFNENSHSYVRIVPYKTQLDACYRFSADDAWIHVKNLQGEANEGVKDGQNMQVRVLYTVYQTKDKENGLVSEDPCASPHRHDEPRWQRDNLHSKYTLQPQLSIFIEEYDGTDNRGDAIKTTRKVQYDAAPVGDVDSYGIPIKKNLQPRDYQRSWEFEFSTTETPTFSIIADNPDFAQESAVLVVGDPLIKSHSVSGELTWIKILTAGLGAIILFRIGGGLVGRVVGGFDGSKQ